jgi:hypothetical protein
LGLRLRLATARHEPPRALLGNRRLGKKDSGRSRSRRKKAKMNH